MLDSLATLLLGVLGGGSRCTVEERNLRVAIIGAGGYVGSRLHDALAAHRCSWHVKGYDRDPRLVGPRLPLAKLAAADIPNAELATFDVVVYLGGLTGRVACVAHTTDEVAAENVHDPVALARRMSSRQLLVFASTSAIAEGSGYAPAAEDAPVRVELLDRYAASMHERERAMEALAAEPKTKAQLIGLRFGTVLGTSPGQRTDLGPMAMIKSAYTAGVVRVKHPETARAFLWLEDQVRAFAAVLESRHEAPRYAIYNLASFNTGVGGLAAAIAHRTGARIETAEHGEPSKDVPGFSLDSAAFRRTFGFEMKGSLEVAVLDIDSHVPGSITAKGAHLVLPTIVAAGSEVLAPSGAAGGAKQMASIPCPVCGSHHLQVALDLNEQPLANDFLPKAADALKAERFPLALMRCRDCNHLHLSQLVSRKRLFSDYLYVSGTSKTLLKHFEKLADKIGAEVERWGLSAAAGRPQAGGEPRQRTVLELASNDGSQLDAFKARGWKTYGVDPAANVVPTAVAKGHQVQVGFWGAQDLWPPSNARGGVALDAIVAQNVLAHVPSPVQFLKDCASAMGPCTLLYIQTSQCHMHEDGQFDTAYHEHLSFFTSHSFRRAAQLSGLDVLSFETTPIHGISCLWTLRRNASAAAPGAAGRQGSRGQCGLEQKGVAKPVDTLGARMREEIELGITTDFFYDCFSARAAETAAWVEAQLGGLSASGYRLGGYGAAAKGMVLLHFLLGRGEAAARLEFVVDDAPMKQDTYCPGTSIPVRRTAHVEAVLRESERPLALVIFAWNFWAEIASNLQKIVDAVPGAAERSIVVILPFPTPRVVTLRGVPLARKVHAPTPLGNPLRDAPKEARRAAADAPLGASHRAPAASTPPRRRVMLVSHFRNEELLLPHFIKHHAHMFDHAVLIDYGSTDASVEIIRREAPPGWKVVPSTEKTFDAVALDVQVMKWEAMYPDDWKIALTTTEFIVHADLRGHLATLDPPANCGGRGALGRALFGCGALLRFPAVLLTGNDTTPLGRFADLVSQRSQYSLGRRRLDQFSADADTRSLFYSRYLHAGMTAGTYCYALGRHGFFVNSWLGTPRPSYIDGGFLVKFLWTPWPESVERKSHVGVLQPESDVKRGFGIHHAENMDTKKLVKGRNAFLKHAWRYDLSYVGQRGMPPDAYAMHRVFHDAGLSRTPRYMADAGALPASMNGGPPIAKPQPKWTTAGLVVAGAAVGIWQWRARVRDYAHRPAQRGRHCLRVGIWQ